MPNFHASVQLCCDTAEVFNFVSRPLNLINLLVPADVKNVDYQVPERLEIGSEIRVQLHQFGMHFEIVHEVVDLVEMERILLHQQKGPFRRWVHEFSFSAPAIQTTHLSENVQFEGPRGLLGFMVTDHKVLEALKKYTSHAHGLLREHFGNARQGST